MRKTISIVALLTLILTSCFSAAPTPALTDVPTRTSTATPLPTQTHQPTNTPKPTATATMIGPSEEQMQEILANAGIEFSADTTNTYTNGAGVECTLRYSDGVLEGTGIDYIQYPEEPLKFMCDNLITKVLYTQRQNDRALEDAFSNIPPDGTMHYGEVYEEMVSIANKYMKENIRFRLNLTYKSGKEVDAEIK